MNVNYVDSYSEQIMFGDRFVNRGFFCLPEVTAHLYAGQIAEHYFRNRNAFCSMA